MLFGALQLLNWKNVENVKKIINLTGQRGKIIMLCLCIMITLQCGLKIQIWLFSLLLL